MHHNDTKEERKKCTLSVICSQSLSKFKVDFLCLSKQNHKMNVFSFVYLPPPSLIKKKPKWWVYSCGELVWNDPIISLLDIAHRCKILHLCYL